MGIEQQVLQESTRFRPALLPLCIALLDVTLVMQQAQHYSHVPFRQLKHNSWDLGHRTTVLQQQIVQPLDVTALHSGACHAAHLL